MNLECFSDKDEPSRSVEAVWRALNDREKFVAMLNTPTLQFICQSFDKWGASGTADAPWPKGYLELAMPDLLELEHTVAILVDTSERIGFRGRGTAQYTMKGCGGGEGDKGMVHAHFACRNGLLDLSLIHI